ncbi:MAG: thioredoxin [Polyangia bacterium]
MSEHVGTTSDETFEQDVLQSEVPVVVDFWAPWCGPCHMVSPILDELAGEYAGKFKVLKVNVDENQQLAMKFGIRSIPTISLFAGGEERDKVIGVRPKEHLAAMIDKVIG